MTTLINLRLIQIKRELKEAGLRSFVILGILLYLIYYSFIVYQKSLDAFLLIGFLFLFCLSLQASRKDKFFLYNHIDNPHLEIFSEYFILTLPFTILSLFTSNWFCFPILIAFLYIIPFLKYTLKQKTYLRKISLIIPVQNFELISGFRKSFLFLIPLYILAIGFCWFRILPLFLLWLISVTIASFYSECEPLHILKEGNTSSKKFLKQKLYQNSKCVLFFYFPILFVNTIYNLDFWIVNLLFIPIQLSLLCLAICFKYSLYRPNKNIGGGNIVLSFVSLSSLVPYLLPIPFIMALDYYGKAKKNLNNYFHD